MRDYKFRKPRSGPVQPRNRVLVDDGLPFETGLLPLRALFIVWEPPDEDLPVVDTSIPCDPKGKSDER